MSPAKNASATGACAKVATWSGAPTVLVRGGHKIVSCWDRCLIVFIHSLQFCWLHVASYHHFQLSFIVDVNLITSKYEKHFQVTKMISNVVFLIYTSLSFMSNQALSLSKHSASLNLVFQNLLLSVVRLPFWNSTFLGKPREMTIGWYWMLDDFWMILDDVGW